MDGEIEDGSDAAGVEELPSSGSGNGFKTWVGRVHRTLADKVPRQIQRGDGARELTDAEQHHQSRSENTTRKWGPHTGGKFMSKIRHAGKDPSYHFVIMNQSLEDYPNISAIKLQFELEKQGHTVETVHWESGDPKIKRIGGVDCLVAEKCELNITDLRNREGFENYEEFSKMLSEHIAREADKKRTGAPPSSLQVDSREDGLYLVYSEVTRDISTIDGVNLMVDRRDDQDKLDQEVNLQQKLEEAGAVPLTSAKAISISKDKVRSSQRLRRYDVPMPKGFEIKGEDFDEADIRERFGQLTFPVMVKDALGSGATGVTACDDIDRAVEVARNVHAMRDIYGVRHSVDIQELIPPLTEDKGHPHLLRIIVLDGKVLGAIKWKAEPGVTELPMKDGVFSPGVTAEIYELSRAQKRIAERAAKACGQGLAGLDAMLRDGRRGKVDKSVLEIIETNSAPGFASFEKHFGEIVPTIVEKFVGMVNRVHGQEIARVH